MKTKETFDEVLENRNKSIYYKLHKAKQDIGAVVKGSNNPFFKSKYADLNSLIDAVEPILLKYDLVLLQPILDGCVCTQVIDIENGQRIESRLELPNIVDPQKKLSTITYYRRGTLQSLLCLQAVDDDGNHAAQPEPKPKNALNDKDFDTCIKLIEEGKATKEKVSSQYELTDVQINTLNEL
tara:strand:- start:1440 stop:1985 length:546 start_codon:yes stop_codon:yes gene_type:complete